MHDEHGNEYRMSRREAAARFVEAFMTIPEKDRDRLVAWWNADVSRKDGKR